MSRDSNMLIIVVRSRFGMLNTTKWCRLTVRAGMLRPFGSRKMVTTV